MSVQLVKNRLATNQAVLKSGISALVLLMGTGNAFAQSAEPAAASTALMIEEVIVTAQKRQENVQSVPIAVSVFSGDNLRVRGITDLQGISQRAPGFNMGSKDAASAQLSIRGIGSADDGAAADNSVIVYIDEVPIGRAAGMDLDLFDLERVEVLRGPQGTLFGRNAVGGAVSLVTRKPDEELRVRVQTKVGNLNRIDFGGYLSGALSDNVFGKVAFSTRNREGYLDSTIDLLPNFTELFPNLSKSLAEDVKAMDENRTSIRGGLRVVASDDLEFNMSVSFGTLDQAGPQRVFIGDKQQFGIGGDLLVPGFRDDFQKEFFEDPGFAKIDSWGSSIRADYTFGGDYTLTSISSFREVDASIQDVISTEAQVRAMFGADVGASGPLLPDVLIGPASNDFQENSKAYTQELRVTSPSGEEIEWVAGVFYLNEKVKRNETVNLGLILRGDDGFLAPVGESGDDQDATTKSYAVFGQMSYAPETLEGLKFTLGLRYTYDEKSISRVGKADGVVVAVPFAFSGSESFDKLTPKAVVSYQATDDVFAFASFSRGFKSGGYQGRGTSIRVVSKPFLPETADSYEIGLKSTWFDGRFQFNPTAFYTDFKDLQIVELLQEEGAPPEATSVLVTQNAANARIYGAELEYIALLAEGLTLTGAVTYLDAKFTEFFAPEGFQRSTGFEGDLEDRVGNFLSKSPKFSTSQVLRYEWSVDSGATMAAQVEYIHKGLMFNSPDNDADVATPAYDLLNVRVSYLSDSDHPFEVALWADNLLDEDYLNQSFAQDGGGRAIPGAPRTYGVTLNWTY